MVWWKAKEGMSRVEYSTAGVQGNQQSAWDRSDDLHHSNGLVILKHEGDKYGEWAREKRGLGAGLGLEDYQGGRGAKGVYLGDEGSRGNCPSNTPDGQPRGSSVPDSTTHNVGTT